MVLLIHCHSIGNDNDQIKALSVQNIKNIETDANKAVVALKILKPNPCWRYHKTEITGTDSIHVKILGRYDGRPCIQIIDYMERSETIRFESKGRKKISFWSGDHETIDTLITINGEP